MLEQTFVILASLEIKERHQLGVPGFHGLTGHCSTDVMLSTLLLGMRKHGAAYPLSREICTNQRWDGGYPDLKTSLTSMKRATVAPVRVSSPDELTRPPFPTRVFVYTLGTKPTRRSELDSSQGWMHKVQGKLRATFSANGRLQTAVCWRLFSRITGHWSMLSTPFEIRPGAGAAGLSLKPVEGVKSHCLGRRSFKLDLDSSLGLPSITESGMAGDNRSLGLGLRIHGVAQPRCRGIWGPKLSTRHLR
ncbi:hypothetical protein BJX63DRAFT_143428 [Aspergillus granulosus]|uniref:Uncharacterized protein n=1 Tax=Aspergillus granulosus TaxID=176169 RepID=A0ABR4HLM1_9EURO